MDPLNCKGGSANCIYHPKGPYKPSAWYILVCKSRPVFRRRINSFTLLSTSTSISSEASILKYLHFLKEQARNFFETLKLRTLDYAAKLIIQIGFQSIIGLQSDGDSDKMTLHRQLRFSSLVTTQGF